MSAIKQIVIFQLKALRMAGFLEFVQQVLNIVRTYRDSGEAGVSQLPAKVEAAYTPFVAGVAKVDEAYKISHSSEYTQQIADEAYRELVLKLNASAVIEDNTEGIEGVISQVNELIKYYRQYVLPKYGKGDKENEGEGGDKPNGGENQGGSGTNSGNGDNGGSQGGGNGGENQGGGTSQGGDNGGGGNGDEPDQ